MADLLPLARFAGSGFHAALGANRSEATPRTTDVSALTLALAATSADTGMRPLVGRRWRW